jgi:hypothetical protein
MRQSINGEAYKMPSTIDDPKILDEITQKFKEHNLIRKQQTEKI